MLLMIYLIFLCRFYDEKQKPKDIEWNAVLAFEKYHYNNLCILTESLVLTESFSLPFSCYSNCDIAYLKMAIKFLLVLMALCSPQNAFNNNKLNLSYITSFPLSSNVIGFSTITVCA
mgnify:FL=1